MLTCSQELSLHLSSLVLLLQLRLGRNPKQATKIVNGIGAVWKEFDTIRTALKDKDN